MTPFRSPLLPSLLALAGVASAGAGASACGDPEKATIGITLGEEADALSRAPAPTTLLVEQIDLDGNAQTLADVTLPQDTLDLGERTRTDAVALRVTAKDPAGKPLLKGQSLYFQYGALVNTSFNVFVQRAGELARMPGAPPVLDTPLTSIALGRYVLAANATSTFIYDLLLLRTLSTPLVLPRAAKSLTTFSTVALAIDELGSSTIDLTAGTIDTVAAPQGGTFAEVSGGAAVAANDGSSFIVGGTRREGFGGPSTKVLQVSKDGVVTFVSITTPREGACATWVEGRGLLVVGGSPDGPGAEVIAPGGTVAAALPYAAFATKDCAVTTLDPTHVLVASGELATPQVLDLSCARDCIPAPWVAPAPAPAPLRRPSLAAIAPDVAILAGDDSNGDTRVFRITPSASAPLGPKTPRRGARLVALPVAGHVGLVGGAGPIEHYVE